MISQAISFGWPSLELVPRYSSGPPMNREFGETEQGLYKRGILTPLRQLLYPLRSFVSLGQSLVMVPTPAKRNTGFDNAYKLFYECLIDKDQMLFGPCASLEDLLDSLRKISSLAKYNNKESFLSRISDFVASL